MSKSNYAFERELVAEEVLSEACNLVHALVQNGDDAYVTIRQPLPVNKVPLIAKEEPFDPKLGWHRLGVYAVRIDALERLEQPGDVAIRLRLAPAVPRVAVNRV